MSSSAQTTGRTRLPLTLLALALAGTCALAPSASSAAAVSRAPDVTAIVTGAGQSVDAVAAAVRAAGGSVVDRLPLVGGVVARLPRGAALAPSLLVAPDRPLQVAGSSGTAAAADGSVVGPRATVGLGGPAGEGAGSTVAVGDTGIADVPGLPRVSHVDVTGAGTGDGFGHGTFVAGLIAGTGASGVPAGIAPGAALLDVRVAASDGTTSLSRVLKGLQVVAAHPEVDVVNLSLSSGSELPYQLDPLTVALEALWQRGVTVVVPSGNTDGSAGSVTSPGLDPVLLTVGGLDEQGTADRSDDAVAGWSGRGPAPQGVDKPDLVAPGASLVSLRAPGSTVDSTYPGSRVGTAGFRGSGTSFSTALASGAAATLMGRRTLSPDQVKALLTGSAYRGDTLGGAGVAGAGGLDVAAAQAAPTPKVTLLPRPDGAQSAAVLQAALAGNPLAALAAWSRLSPQTRLWVSRNWASRNWADGDWASRNWADLDWLSRNWASSTWAGSTWSGSTWSGSTWSGSTWSDSTWSGSTWSGSTWSGSTWSSSSWSAADWS